MVKVKVLKTTAKIETGNVPITPSINKGPIYFHCKGPDHIKVMFREAGVQWYVKGKRTEGGKRAKSAVTRTEKMPSAKRQPKEGK
jgi:hypothetical protein